MKKEHVKAAVVHAKDSVKEVAGAMAGDNWLQTVKFDKTKDSARKDLKDLARHAVKTAKHRLKADTSPSDVDIPGDD
jgi:hypothetical protein